MDAIFLLSSSFWCDVNFLTLLFGGLVMLLLLKLLGYLQYKDLFKSLYVNSDIKIGSEIDITMKNALHDFQSKYGFTERGFLPDSCLEKLPEYYMAWEEIASNLPELNRLDKLKDEILKMRLLSCDKLETMAMLRRAYILLGMLVHSYVNGEHAAWDKLVGKSEAQVHEREAGKSERCISTEVNEYTDNCCEGEKGSDGSYKQKSSSAKKNKAQNHCSGVDIFSNVPCVPYQLAIPWFTICQRLDLPLILTAALDLWNWKLKDNTKPHELSNLTSLITMTQTETEINFHMVPCAMHYVTAPIMPQIFNLYGDIAKVKVNKESTVENVISFMERLSEVYKQLTVILKRVTHLVDVDTFYDVYRPLLNGFWPDGVLFQLAHDNDMEDCLSIVDEPSDILCQPKKGKDNRTELETVKVTNGNEKFTMTAKSLDFLTHNITAFDSVITKRLPNEGVIASPKGPSAGQSTMIVLFDLVLGIKHVGSGRDFQDEMANYMPAPHRQMIVDLKHLIGQYGTLRDIIIRSIDMPLYGKCVSAYNECIRAVADFRSLHLGIAVKYLMRTRKGTGASSFRDMLNEMVLSTKESILEA